MTDRETLEKMAKNYRELAVLQASQRAVTAQMIRACIARLRKPSLVARKEAMEGLTQLAEMLEKDA